MPWDRVEFAADPDWEWHSAADDSPAELYALWQAAVDRSRAAWTALLADGGLDQPSKRTVPGWGTPNLRRIIVDLHDEYARHVGHADLHARGHRRPCRRGPAATVIAGYRRSVQHYGRA